MSFVPDHFIDQLSTLSRHDADAQQFGIVQVDDAGVIKLYNKWESDLVSVPVASAEGRNFFTHVAPCTNNRLVFGKFKDGVSADHLDTEFNYTFTYKTKPTNVLIRLLRHKMSRTNWVFVGLRVA
jgi:photoactive yellow protein